jgi:hypothetical protein
MEQENTIILHTYNNLQEATIAMDKLKENGINAYLKEENVMGLDPIGGAELRIFEKDKAAAEGILAS